MIGGPERTSATSRQGISHAAPLARRSGRLLQKRRRAFVDFDQAHVAEQHVEEPWEALDSGVAKKSTHPSNPSRKPDWSCVFGNAHIGTELQHVKSPPATSYARLPFEHRTGAVETDRSGNDDHQGQRERQQDASNHSIGNTVHLIRQVRVHGGQRASVAIHSGAGRGLLTLLTFSVQLRVIVGPNHLQLYDI
jgi:hypothetical protein